MNALVIAGGQWQVPLIKYLKSQKYIVTVVDPYTSSKGVQEADFHIQADVRNRELILSKISSSYDIVCTDQSDISVDTVAFIAEKLQIKGNQESIVKKFSNKYESRVYAERVNVPVPKYRKVSSVIELKDFIDQVNLPLIIKPCDSQSSKGIHKIEKADDELAEFLDDALKYSFVKAAIVEQFVSGYEITVEGFCANRKHKVLAISKKKHFKTGIASTLTYPASLPNEIEQKIIEADNRYVENSGLEFGPTHAEYLVNEETGEFYLVEIACRGGGTLISSDIVKWVSGFDVYDAYLKCLKGEIVDITHVIPLKRSAELHFFEFGDGKIIELNGFEEAARIKGVLMLDFNYKVGDIISSCKDDRSRQGFFIALAQDNVELQKIVHDVCNTISVKLVQ